MTIKRYGVPEYSQYLDIRSKKWNWRSCGVVSLFMILSYWDPTIKRSDLPRLITYGVSQGAYREGVGWVHQGLLDLAIGLGFTGKRFDFFKQSDTAAFKSFLAQLKKGPVIISIYKGFNSNNGGGHLIVATGYMKRGETIHIMIADPEADDRTKIKSVISQKKLMNGWKRRFIAITAKNT